MGQLEVEGGRRIYFEHHPGAGAAVLLVHGWGLSARLWDLTLPALLEAGHEVVSFDQRCCGRSDKDFADVSLNAAAADVGALVATTELETPVLLGWSLGAAICIEAAGALGSALAGLCLVCPTSPRHTEAVGFPHGQSAQVMEDTLRGLRENRPDFLHGLAERTTRSDIGANAVEWLWQQLLEASPRADRTMADLGELDQRGLLPEIEVPTLVISGSEDGLIEPQVHHVCADLLPNSRLVEFSGSGHAPFLEERARFNEELLGFLADPAGTVLGHSGAVAPVSFAG